jgi:cell wall-associated NlpC family hydrolase
MSLRSSRRSAAALVFFFFATVFPVFAVPISTVKPVETRRRVVAAAKSYTGVPYRSGGTDGNGLDCSGLVALCYRDAIDIDIRRTALELHDLAEVIDRSELQSGDLVFFDTTGPYTHVGIYIGKTRFLHAASEGPSTGVIITSLDEEYWKRSFSGAGRLIAPAHFLGLLSVSR